jgi:membrane protease YdiL (CAAX protease family)
MAFTSALLVQGVIFLLPHLALLSIMPELRGLLLVVFAGGIVAGWLRLRSHSILAPWLVHGAVNTAICLSVAARTAGGEI